MQRTIFSTTQIRCLANSYHPLNDKEKLLDALSMLVDLNEVRQNHKYDIIKIYNKLLISNHVGESILKHFLFREYLNKNVTAAFEIKVNSSRLDFLAINGYTTSFEIKTALDNLKRLKKQSSDYSKAFEFNNVVVDEKHVENSLTALPDHYGVWNYTRGKKVIAQKGCLSRQLDPEFQLELLTQKELRNAFREVDGVKCDILNSLDMNEINRRFKQTLKLRYGRKWSFVKSHSKRILPIDVQFFFSTNLLPELVYGIKPD